MSAILSLSPTLHVVLALAAFFAILWFAAWLDYRRLCRRLPKQPVAERPDRDWLFPPKWEPPTNKTKERPHA